MKEHAIETIQDLVDIINSDNYEDIRKDLSMFVDHIVIAKAAHVSAGMSDKLELKSFVWVDDKKHVGNMVFDSGDGGQFHLDLMERGAK